MQVKIDNMRHGSLEGEVKTFRDTVFWESLSRLMRWLEINDLKAYDPFDGLASYLRPVTFRLKFPQQVLQQFVRRNPFNLRPILGISPHTSTKGMGYYAAACLKLHTMTGEEQYRDKAVSALDWLMRNRSEGYSGYCWGNSFDYVSRGFYLPAHQPTLVWSSLIGHQFIEAFHHFQDQRYLDVARGVAQFILRDLPRIRLSNGTCISYVTHTENAVHNANLLGARMLAEVYAETGEQECHDLALTAARYGAKSQLENGAWYYGEARTYHWIDNWHTAYNLDALWGVKRGLDTQEFDSQLVKGVDFFFRHFFTPGGGPKYYWNREYKFDIQSSSQAIDTLVLFSVAFDKPEYLTLARTVAAWTIRNMQDQDGYFYLWKNKWFTNKTPTFHWGGTTMLHALAHMLLVMTERGDYAH